MKRLRVYVDTSVFGGCFDREFSLWSNMLIKDFKAGLFVPVVSEVTSAEINMAPAQVRDLYAGIRNLAEILPISDEALEVQKAYDAQGVLGPKFQNDMLHIAIATVANVDVVVSWNFRHIVRLDKIRLFNSTNISLGYKML